MPAMMFDMELFELANKVHRIVLHSEFMDKDDSHLIYVDKN